jgi:transcriptional regulator with XRE-family HTH domain
MSHLQGAFVSLAEKFSVGRRIADLRGNQGVSEFAAVLGINRKTVTRWEADETLPDGASLLALKEKFGADPGWVLTGIGDAPNISTLTPDEQVLLDGYRSLDPATKKRMLAFMLGGLEPANKPAPQAVTVTASGHGTQAAGRKIVNKGKS